MAATYFNYLINNIFKRSQKKENKAKFEYVEQKKVEYTTPVPREKEEYKNLSYSTGIMSTVPALISLIIFISIGGSIITNITNTTDTDSYSESTSTNNTVSSVFNSFSGVTPLLIVAIIGAIAIGVILLFMTTSIGGL